MSTVAVPTNWTDPRPNRAARSSPSLLSSGSTSDKGSSWFVGTLLPSSLSFEDAGKRAQSLTPEDLHVDPGREMHERRRAQQGRQLGPREERLAERLQGHALEGIRPVANASAEEVPSAASEQDVPFNQKMVERARHGRRRRPLD